MLCSPVTHGVSLNEEEQKIHQIRFAHWVCYTASWGKPRVGNQCDHGSNKQLRNRALFLGIQPHSSAACKQSCICPECCSAALERSKMSEELAQFNRFAEVTVECQDRGDLK
jgi:hypothetical protein